MNNSAADLVAKATAASGGATLTCRDSKECGGEKPEVSDAPGRNSAEVALSAVATAGTDGDEDPDWKFISQVENVAFQFQEKKGCSLPYELEVIWIQGGCERFISQGMVNIDARGNECAELFVPLIEDAARKAKSMKSFMVRYNNGLDRTWPYTKVCRVAEVICRARGDVDATLESVDEEYFEYVVNLVPKSKENRKKRKTDATERAGSLLASGYDFSHINMIRKHHVLNYIGSDIMGLMQGSRKLALTLHRYSYTGGWSFYVEEFAEKNIRVGGSGP